jgi:hypothetical protein
MTPLLAEISDKMPTVIELWVWMLVLSIPALVGVVHKRVSWIVLVVALPFSAWLGYWAYHEAFLELGFSQAVQGEMGRVWIAHSLASACLPAAVAFVVLCWHMKRRKAMPQPGGASNGGPATLLGNSGVIEGPPSVT